MQSLEFPFSLLALDLDTKYILVLRILLIYLSIVYYYYYM